MPRLPTSRVERPAVKEMCDCCSLCQCLMCQIWVCLPRFFIFRWYLWRKVSKGNWNCAIVDALERGIHRDLEDVTEPVLGNSEPVHLMAGRFRADLES